MFPHTSVCLFLLIATPAAIAWSGDADTPHHAELAELALDALDDDQAAPIQRNLEAYRAGALDADGELAPEFHRYSPETGKGRAIDYVTSASQRLVVNLTTRNATPEDARQLGIFVHVLLDLTQPLHTGNGTIDAPHHAEYETAAARASGTPELQPVPPEDGNVTTLARAIAEASARRAPELEDLLRKEGPWSQRLADLTNATLQDGTPRVARALASLLPLPPAAPPSYTPPTLSIDPPPPATTPIPPPSPPVQMQGAMTPTPAESFDEERATPSSGLVALLGALVMSALARSVTRRRR